MNIIKWNFFFNKFAWDVFSEVFANVFVHDSYSQMLSEISYAVV